MTDLEKKVEQVITRYIKIPLILFVVWIGAFFFIPSCNSFRKSTIEDKTNEKISKCSIYALCLRSTNSKSGVGANIRDCNVILNDITTIGKLTNYENCLKINKSIDSKEEKVKCKDLVFKENSCD